MDASSLSDYDKQKLNRIARRAGEKAAAKRARKLMPFSDESPSLQKLAAWMTTLDELQKFHKTTLRGDREKVRSSIELWWGAQVRGRQMQGGVIRRTFDPSELGGSFKQCCLKIAGALGSYRESDEIHEVRGGFWALRAPGVEIVGKGMAERIFAYKPARGKFGDELRAMRAVVGSVLTRDKEEHYDAELQRLDDQLAITVATALGYEGKLKKASDEARQKAYDQAEKELLESRQKPEKEPKNRPWNR